MPATYACGPGSSKLSNGAFCEERKELASIHQRENLSVVFTFCFVMSFRVSSVEFVNGKPAQSPLAPYLLVLV